MRADKLWGLKSGQSSPGQKGKKAGLARARQHPGGLTSHLSSPEAPDPSTQPQPSQSAPTSQEMLSPVPWCLPPSHKAGWRLAEQEARGTLQGVAISGLQISTSGPESLRERAQWCDRVWRYRGAGKRGGGEKGVKTG